MMKTPLYLIVFLFLLPAFATKKNICAITINSENEFNSFRKTLPSEQFNFYELTSSDSKNWFKNACASKIQCDVLIISGHFATQFFGDRGLNLTTQQLEENSCQQSCDGITQKPREVFLFGCNTLADKKPDQRTPEQYMRILMNDGFRESTARAIAMARYSPIDHSFRQRMGHVFHDAAIVYGFSAAGPKGHIAESSVRQFLKNFGDYSKHLDRLANNDSKELSISQKNWNQNFKIYNGSSEINKGDIKTETELVCQANDYTKSKKNALVGLDQLLNKGNRLAYLLLTEKLLRNLTPSMLSLEEKQAFISIKNNLEFKNEVLSGFKYLSYNIELSLKIIRMMDNLGWLNQEQYQNLTNQTLGNFLTQPNLKNSDYDSICDLGFWHRQFDYPLTNSQLANHKLIQVLGCLRVKNDQLNEQLRFIYKQPSVTSQIKSEIFVFLYRQGISIE